MTKAIVDTDADRAIIAGATSKPWKVEYDERNFVHRIVTGPHDSERIAWISDYGNPHAGNAAFIAEAHARWPAALDRIDFLEAALNRIADNTAGEKCTMPREFCPGCCALEAIDGVKIK